MRLHSAALLQDNPVIHGGAAGRAIGISLVSGAILESTGDTIEGGTGWDADPEYLGDNQVIGVDVNMETQATLTDSEVFGVAANATVVPERTFGVITFNWSTLSFSGGLISAGDAVQQSCGLSLSGTLTEATLTDVAVTAGDTTSETGSSRGIEQIGDALTITGGTVASGQGLTSYGIYAWLSGPQGDPNLTSLTNVEVVAGPDGLAELAGGVSAVVVEDRSVQVQGQYLGA